MPTVVYNMNVFDLTKYDLKVRGSFFNRDAGIMYNESYFNFTSANPSPYSALYTVRPSNINRTGMFMTVVNGSVTVLDNQSSVQGTVLVPGNV
jgi:hypothetical protein